MERKEQGQEMPQWAEDLVKANQVLLEKVLELEGQIAEAKETQNILNQMREKETNKMSLEARRKISSNVVKDLLS